MKKATILLMLFFCIKFIYADPITQTYAEKIALNYYKISNPSKSANVSISSSFAIKSGSLTTMYIFNMQPSGFVIVAADDASTPILGQSITGQILENQINPELQWWLSSYSSQITYISNNKLSNKITLKEWKNIEFGNISNAKSTNAVSPLLGSINWDQGQYYNDSCPTASGGPSNKAYAGCVATSMGQILKKWSYPSQGNGYHSYTSTSNGVLHANYGITTYNWSGMPNSISNHNSSVAQLLYHLGVSVDMSYAASGSGASTYDIPNALINYFKYQPTAEYLSKDSYTATEWDMILQNELNQGRPINYSGTNSSGQNGHSFVFDGYQTTSGTQYHINWGWSGSNNGYFTVANLNPSGYNFSYYCGAVIRIQPLSNAPIASFASSTTTPASGGSVNFTDGSLNTPTGWTWTFEGGTPSTSNSQNPTGVTFATNGYKLVSLQVSNANGYDVKYGFINVGGTSSAWILQNTGFTTAARGISDIRIVNPQVVWATAYDGSGSNALVLDFTRTVNGGISWIPGTVSFTGSSTYALSNIWPFSDTVAYACVNPGAGTGGKILKTTNGGVNWVEQTVGTNGFTGSWADFVGFFDQANGVCLGDPVSNVFRIYTTTNGGSNWTLVPSGNIPTALSNEAGINNFFEIQNNLIWFTTNSGRVYKSTDLGYHWTVSTPTGCNGEVHVSFDETGNNGILIQDSTTTSSQFKFLKSTNAGSTWYNPNPTGYFMKGNNISSVPGTPNMWVLVGVYQSMHKGSCYSNDGCSSFLNIDTGSVQYTYVKFYDKNTGWAGGYNSSSTVGGIYKWNNLINTSGINNKNDIKTDFSVNLYPNPSSGIYNLTFTGEIRSKSIVEIYDMTGKLVYNQIFDTEINKNCKIDLSIFNNGLYFVKVNYNNTSITKKISLIK